MAICKLHPANGEQEECEACKLGHPPDVGIEINDSTNLEDKGPGQH